MAQNGVHRWLEVFALARARLRHWQPARLDLYDLASSLTINLTASAPLAPERPLAGRVVTPEMAPLSLDLTRIEGT